MDAIEKELKELVRSVKDTDSVTTENIALVEKIKAQIDKAIYKPISKNEKRKLLEWRFLIDSLEVE